MSLTYLLVLLLGAVLLPLSISR
ncbi:hypothetical protein Pint_14634 [Pistacia integerrima]|uniref:Uncharacterized protein n=1 Tax=Pistacia integerrima TaxID=434235 RepID=A0ACC0Y8F5_9ROSI|nr:hypothetical protein Pint_14634 [Pistacia integerrima]